MPRITTIHWKIFDKFLIHVGCKYTGIKADHRKYKKNGLDRPVIIPMENDLPIEIILTNLRTLKIGRAEYLNIIKEL